MKIDLDKTKFVVFRNGGIVKQTEKWTYCGDTIDIVPFYKYLGVYFTPKLLWSKTQEMLALQGIKSVACIFRFQRKFGHLNSVDMFKVFDAMVKPILCYCSEIWGYQYVEKIEKVQIKFCKQYCNLSQNTSDILALGECGRLPLCITYIPNCIKFWLRILRMENHRYPKQCYNMLKQLDEAGRRTWASNIKELLFTYGFGYVWIAQEVGNESNFIQLFKTRIKDCFLQRWSSSLDNSSKALHYKHFKSHLYSEPYLDIDLSYTLRKTLSNFRCSSHALMIEKGRHLSIDRDLRFCPLCIKNNIYVVEDEFHFFFECNEYEIFRQTFFKPNWLNNRSLNKFYIILSLKDEKSLFIIARYLSIAFARRKETLDLHN